MGLAELRRSVDLKERMASKTIHIGRNSGTLKGNKPLMERYRRQKINRYLEELKWLVLTGLNKEVSLYNKMEKADILEMAVRYIKAVRTATAAETSTIKFSEQPAHSTTTPHVYRWRGPSLQGAHSINYNYDNLYQRSRGMDENDMKENFEMTSKKNSLSGTVCVPLATRTLNSQTQHSQQQFLSPMQGKNVPKSLTCQTENHEPTTEAEIPTKIWRPW